MKRKIVADSSCDLLELDGVDFVSAPLTISTDKTSYVDDANLDVDKMLDELEVYQGRSYTACPSVNYWLESYEGADEIFVVTISGNISGSYNAAIAAKDIYLQSHPDVKIHVFDSLSAGPEERLLVERIVEMMNENRTFEEIVETVSEYSKKTTKLFFMLQSVHNFVQNGRISKLAATAVGILGLRLLGTASANGELELVSKSRGEKKLLVELMAQLKNFGYNGGKLYIMHIQNLNFANEIEKAVHAIYPKAKTIIYAARGLCSYYAERGGMLVGFETE